MAGKITYNNISILFARDWNRFSARNIVNNSVVQAASGVEQTVNFFDQDFVTAERDFLTPQEVIELEEFYAFASNGSTFSFERDRDLGTYIGFEGKSLNTNDGTAGTFTITEVTDSAYYLDPSTGNLTTVGITATDSNTPRFPAGKYGGGVLIEGLRKNEVTDPSVINGNWTRSGVTLTTTNTTETVDPAGANNSELLTAAGGADFFEFDTSTAISTNDGVASLYLKSASGNVNVVLSIRSTTAGSLGTSGAINITPAGPDGNGWTRITATHESSGSVADNWRLRLTFSNADAIYAYGGQIEVGTDVLFASQLIGAVSTSSITRNAEKLLYSDANILNKEKGTLSFWVKPEYDAGKQEGETIFFQSGTTATNSHVRIGYLNTTANLFIRAKLNNSSTTAWSEFAASGGFIIKDTFAHIVYTYDSTISNGGKLYANGVLRLTTTNDPFNISDTGDQFTIGSNLDGTNVAFSVIDDFEIYKDVKDSTWINRRFNLGRGVGLRRNRWTSMKLANPDFSPIWQVGDRYQMKLQMKEVLT